MTWERALDLVRQGSRFLVTCHRRPDADALGSALGFARFLRSIGKEAELYVPEELPPNLRFLCDDGEILRSLRGLAFDSTWVMDTAAGVLLPEGVPHVTGGPLVVIDHHTAHDGVGDLVVRDVSASATGEVILNLIEDIGLESLEEPVATPIYAAIVADTGGFRYPATKASTLRIGARLLEAGVDPWEVAYNLFEGWERPRLDLLSAIIETLELDLDGRLATLIVTRKMLADVGADDDMVEGMVNYGRMLRGVEMAALVWEWPVIRDDGSEALEIKVSLRSRGSVDVSAIATALGGGGHQAAAGAQVEGDVRSVLERVKTEARQLLP